MGSELSTALVSPAHSSLAFGFPRISAFFPIGRLFRTNRHYSMWAQVAVQVVPNMESLLIIILPTMGTTVNIIIIDETCNWRPCNGITVSGCSP